MTTITYIEDKPAAERASHELDNEYNEAITALIHARHLAKQLDYAEASQATEKAGEHMRTVRTLEGALIEYQERAETAAQAWLEDHAPAECDEAPEGVECTRDHAAEAEHDLAEQAWFEDRDLAGAA